MKHPIRKKWGQNFLIDQNIQRKIVDILDLNPNDNVLEIGPGYGALTKLIAPKCKQLTVVEIDPLLANEIHKLSIPNISIINKDFLNIDLENFPRDLKCISNLPYYITTPIIFKILEWSGWEKCVFMMQKEVAERLVSEPKTKSYGRLTISAKLFGMVNLEFKVSSNVFQPKPEVDSAIISITRYNDFNYSSKFIKDFQKIVKIAFSTRRKILKNSLKGYLNDYMIEEYGKFRPEECSMEDFMKIVSSCQD